MRTNWSDNGGLVLCNELVYRYRYRVFVSAFVVCWRNGSGNGNEIQILHAKKLNRLYRKLLAIMKHKFDKEIIDFGLHLHPFHVKADCF